MPCISMRSSSRGSSRKSYYLVPFRKGHETYHRSGRKGGDVEGRFLPLLTGEPTLAAKEIAQEIDISARTVERYLKLLQRQER
ncbi:TPA: HTH domain-containing protein [Raoultella planticola]